MPSINFSLKSLSATKLRLVLLVSAVLIICAQVGLITLGQQLIRSLSEPTSEAVARASSSQKTLEDLKVAELLLEDQKDTVEKAKNIAADTTNTYQYQTQIIDDITNYASHANLAPTSFMFSDGNTGGAGGEGAAAAVPTPDAAAAAPVEGAAAPGAGASAAAGSTVTVTVTFDGGVTYESLFRFLKLLEGSLLRMEIDSLSLTKPTGGGGEEGTASPDTLDISSLNIKVYTR